VITGVWTFVLSSVAVCFAGAGLFILNISWRHSVSPVALAKKCAAVFVVAISTASSAATFDTNRKACVVEFGLEPSFVDFALPLSMVIHRPICAASFMLSTFYFAGHYDVCCSVAWLVMAVISCSILAIACPPVSGSGAVVFTMLFTQMGIPAEALTLALALDAILDFVITACEQVGLPMTLIDVAPPSI